MENKYYFFFGRNGRLNRVKDEDRRVDYNRFFAGNYFRTAKDANKYKHLFINI